MANSPISFLHKLIVHKPVLFYLQTKVSDVHMHSCLMMEICKATNLQMCFLYNTFLYWLTNLGTHQYNLSGISKYFSGGWKKPTKVFYYMEDFVQTTVYAWIYISFILSIIDCNSQYLKYIMPIPPSLHLYDSFWYMYHCAQ